MEGNTNRNLNQLPPPLQTFRSPTPTIRAAGRNLDVTTATLSYLMRAVRNSCLLVTACGRHKIEDSARIIRSSCARGLMALAV